MDNFETKLKRIEEISKLLEDDELDLNSSVKLYKEGLKLIKQSRDILENTKLKIIQIEQEDG